MNKTVAEVKDFISALKTNLKKHENEIIICTPFTTIPTVTSLAANTQINVGAQNCHFENLGAYTGEISPSMLKELDVKYVILGHSERRDYFFETDELINKKIKSALNVGLKVILCIGETAQERKIGITEEKISIQIKKALYGIEKKNLFDIIIAYEPIWAIGSKKNATKEDANRICGIIRKILAGMYDSNVAEDFSILYGGSVNASNARELLSMENIDGGLIGGASLDVEEFLKIIESVSD
ncbi:triosephosphate isomerase [Clostridium sp. CAG:557]|nr:triosephosphate isomerase [Clostridium sp. CAG:557]